LTGDWGIGSINGLAREDADMSTIAETTMQTLADYFQMSEDQAKEDVYAYTMQSVIDELETTMASFQLLMTAVASISLVVGGIGIMNMMLTNVTERIREIGLRKALGARSSDITKQFLLESICLCLAGGVIGIACGYGGAYLLGQFATGLMTELNGTEGGPVTPVIDTKSVLMVAGICIAIGIIFGYYPARRAAKLDPVESLHYQ
jgi:putative ABC transport system permease protein